MGALKSVAIAVAGSWLMLAAPGFTADEAAAALCHQLAASPFDPAVAGGEGVALADIDSEQAIDACRRAAKADRGNATLRLQLGRAFDAAGDYARAVAEYEHAASLGNMLAVTSLGQMYEGGFGVPQDEAKAAELFSQAANEGVVLATESLAKLYEEGRGVEQDYLCAAQLYQIAAKDGSAWAMANLGWLFENGWGVSEDDVEAARLYQLAADQGIDFAQNNLGAFYANGVGGLERDDSAAVRFFRLAADQGHVLANINLAHHYADGLGVKRSLAKAEEHLRFAIERGTADEQGRALNNLAWMLATENTRLDEAEPLAREAVALDPSDANRIDTLAWVLHLDGRSPEALPLMEEAATLRPDDSVFAEHLEAIKAALDQ